MKKLFAIILFFTLSLSLQAEYQTIELKFYNSKNDSKILEMGIDKNATWDWDSTLGEKYFVPMFPPGGFAAAIEYVDYRMDTITVDGVKKDSLFIDVIWTPKEVVPYTDTLNFVRLFKVKTQRAKIDGDRTLFIERLETNSDLNIDSVVIVNDIQYTPSFNKKINEKESLEVTNEYINEFYVKVYYNFNSTNVFENNSNVVANIYPNPCTEWLNTRNTNEIKLFDIFGKEVLLSIILNENDRVNISSLNDGIYYAVFYDNFGKRNNMQIIKMK